VKPLLSKSKDRRGERGSTAASENLIPGGGDVWIIQLKAARASKKQ
jgi:hypothetical protein